jgi:hypothetical protein
MRKNLLIGTAVAFLACAAGWGWFMMSHPQSIHAIAAGWKHGAGIWRHDAGDCSHDTVSMQHVIEIEPLPVAEKASVPDSSEPVEVIDLTELQRIPQPPMETAEPPLAAEAPAVFREPASPELAVKPAKHEVPSEPVPPELSERMIPADFLLHSADGRPPALDLLNSISARLHRQLHGRASDRELVDGPPKMPPATGYDYRYHQQYPGCTYLAGSSFDRVPELLPEPTLLPKPSDPGRKNSKRNTLEILPGDVPSFWIVTPF